MSLNIKALKALAKSLRAATTHKCESCGKQVQEDYLINSLCGECNDTKEEDDAFHAEMDKSKLASLGRKISSLNRQLRVIKLADFGADMRGDMQRIHDEVNAPGYKAKEQACEDFLNNWDPGDLWDEMFWTKDFNAERAFEAMKYAAEAEGVTLTDADTWNYEDRLWQTYNESEKGLS